MNEYIRPRPTGECCESAAQVVLSSRKAAGLTQRELALSISTTASVISAYENGRVDPTVSTLIRIVNACDLRLRIFPDLPRSGERTQSSDPDLPRRQSRVREIMRLRAEAHAEAERLYGKPKVMPGFQATALRLLREAHRSESS